MVKAKKILPRWNWIRGLIMCAQIEEAKHALAESIVEDKPKYMEKNKTFIFNHG